MYVNDAECEAAGLDPKEVERIARGLSRYAKQAKALNLHVFGGAGSGTLRYGSDYGALVCADLEGTFDGGDGATDWDSEGLLRGEFNY